MQVDRASYRKTMLVAGVAAIGTLGSFELARMWLQGLAPALALNALAAAGWVAAAAFLLLAVASALVMYRDLRNERGQLDLFELLNAGRADAHFLGEVSARKRRIPLRWLRRLLGAPQFIVGDEARVRPLSEIMATLDASGCIDGLPFMPEMVRFCGQKATVFRCVDKVYDYGGRKDLRRISDVVLLAGLRCDGGMHDGCQAGCYALWHTSWLREAGSLVGAGEGPVAAVGGQAGAALSMDRLRELARRNVGPGESIRYVCQYTEIVSASKAMKSNDLRQDIRPLIAGNVTLAAFAVAVFTRFFNRAQGLRGGVGYPPGRSSMQKTSPKIDRGLKAGDWVEVESPDAIGKTLDSTGRNRGLWFDRDMLKHCGRRYRVHGVVERIIDDTDGQMRPMKLPCLVLDGVSTSGEFLRFCAQHDFPFWREAWLTKVEKPTADDRS